MRWTVLLITNNPGKRFAYFQTFAVPLRSCENLHQSATTLQPVTAEVKNTDHLLQCNALVGNLGSWRSCGRSLTRPPNSQIPVQVDIPRSHPIQFSGFHVLICVKTLKISTPSNILSVILLSAVVKSVEHFISLCKRQVHFQGGRD